MRRKRRSEREPGPAPEPESEREPEPASDPEPGARARADSAAEGRPSAPPPEGRGAGTGPPAVRAAAAYWTQGGTENSPLAYFGGYTTLAVPSVYHWITTMDGAPSSYGAVRSNLML